MEEKFNLSDAIVEIKEVYKEVYEKDKVIHIENVKEFIKRLKEKIINHNNIYKTYFDIKEFEIILNNLAGEELR